MTTVEMALDTDSRAIPKSLSNLFAAPRPEYCQRCSDKVYYAEKVGPVNGVIFHKQCFRCATCQQHLTMKTYFTNQVDIKDKEVFCGTHTPRGATVGLDANAIGIRGALMVPKVGMHSYNEQIKSGSQAPLITGQALYISHPLAAQKGLGYRYKQQHNKHHFPAYVVSTLQVELCLSRQRIIKYLCLSSGATKERRHLWSDDILNLNNQSEIPLSKSCIEA